MDGGKACSPKDFSKDSTDQKDSSAQKRLAHFFILSHPMQCLEPRLPERRVKRDVSVSGSKEGLRLTQSGTGIVQPLLYQTFPVPQPARWSPSTAHGITILSKVQRHIIALRNVRCEEKYKKNYVSILFSEKITESYLSLCYQLSRAVQVQNGFSHSSPCSYLTRCWYLILAQLPWETQEKLPCWKMDFITTCNWKDKA